jgi:hypothetical protein
MKHNVEWKERQLVQKGEDKKFVQGQNVSKEKSSTGNHRLASPFIRLQTGNFHLFLRQQRTTTNFRLHDEQSENGLRKIAWASVFCFVSETFSLEGLKCRLFMGQYVGSKGREGGKQ